jgi:Tfp pilus assembly protein PilF
VSAETIPPPTRDQVRRSAWRLRAEAARAGEAGLNLRARDVLANLPLPFVAEPLPPTATAHDAAESALEPLEYADGVLTRYGIRCRPSLAAAGSDGVVTLRPTRRFAVQGAALTGIAALFIGGFVSKVALIGFLPFVIVGIGLVLWQMPRLDRWMPQFVPRGRALGALVMVILIAISTVAVVRPVRERLTAQGNRTNALILVKEADAQLATGDIAGAILSARGAVDNDASAPGAKETLARVDALARAQIADAESSQAAGKWDLAISQLERVGTFYNAPRRILSVRHEAGVSMIEDAAANLETGDATAAFNAYNAAIAFDPAVEDPYLFGAIIYVLTKN